jgi:Ca2+-binding RTX toxin-like protein
MPADIPSGLTMLERLADARPTQPHSRRLQVSRSPASRGALQRHAHPLHRLAAGATLGLLALAVAVGSAQAAPALKTKIQNNTLTITGSAFADVIVLRLSATDANMLEIDSGGDGSADFTFNRSRFDEIEIEAAGGNDTIRIDHSNGVFTTDEKTLLNGEAGNDTLIGSAGPEFLLGGDGADQIDGNQGSDMVLAGAGDDVMTWDPGDASDTLEGGAGSDRLLFNGANIGEIFEVSANGGRVSFTRNIATIVLDLDDVERIDVAARGGADLLTVNDLAGTDLGLVQVDLTVIGGGDALADGVIVNGSAADDTVELSAANGGVEASRTGTATTRVIGAEPALDVLTVNGLAGDDLINVGAGVQALIQLILNP